MQNLADHANHPSLAVKSWEFIVLQVCFSQECLTKLGPGEPDVLALQSHTSHLHLLGTRGEIASCAMSLQGPVFTIMADMPTKKSN